jgi:RimJ/RimL family protein N-acetyltransferase
MVLRTPNLGDAEQIRIALSDHRLTRWFSRNYPPPKRKCAVALVRHIIAARESGEYLTLMCFDRTSDKLLASVGLSGFDWVNRNAELGYWVTAGKWGKGLATEAASALCARSFKTLNLHRIEAQVFPSNHASVGVLTNLGFVREGASREKQLKGRTWFDLEMYGLLRKDFKG